MARLSATSIRDFKCCPYLYYLRHVLRIRPTEQTESQRCGTNWHKCLELLTGENPRQQLADHLNEAYSVCPPNVQLPDWELEKTILLYSALAWHEYYKNDQVETIAREIPFDHGDRKGRIDRIVRWNGRLLLGEYKSTTRPIDSGSDYWNGLNYDDQLTFYLLEARAAQCIGELTQFGIAADDPLISGFLFDVWKRPTIRPKKLSKADQKKFLETGEYCGEQFDVGVGPDDPGDADSPPSGICTTVNGVIMSDDFRETPKMFGARLMQEMCEEPAKYFARREIARTDAELAAADEEYHKISRLIDMTEKRDLWYHNRSQCRARYRCEMTPICDYNLEVSEDNVPDGFTCLKEGNQNGPEETTPQD